MTLSGCAPVKEGVQVFLGTSTRALEEARVTAETRTFSCGFWECYEAVLSLAHNEEAEPLSEKKYFRVFTKDPVESHIIVMGVPGNINTTEVGIFFSQPGREAIRVEIASLSSSAKERVAEVVFNELSIRFPSP